MTLPKKMAVAQYFALLTVLVCFLEESINTIQRHENQASKEGKLKRHYAAAREDTSENAAN